jgi:hypothetical protein
MGRAVSRAVRAGGRDPVTRATLGQIVTAAQHAVTRVFHGVGQVIVASTADTLADGLGVVAGAAGRLGLNVAVLEDARTAAQALAAKRAYFEGMRRRVMITNATDAAALIRERLALVPVDEARVGQAIDAAVEAAGDQWWKVERVAATEASAAFNSAQDVGMSILWAGEPGLMKRWTELVDDATGRPLDNRVAPDSMVMHGQLAKPGGKFRMPSSAIGKFSSALMIGSWDHPPNRPHDRAVLVPWLPGQGVLGYELRGARKYRRS